MFDFFLLVLSPMVAQTIDFAGEVEMLWSEGVRLICIDVLIIFHGLLRNKLYIKL